MKWVDPQYWTEHQGGAVWKLVVNRRLRYSITYLGRGRGGGPMRWKVQDHKDVEGTNDIPEFSSLDEAKAWAEAIITLE